MAPSSSTAAAVPSEAPSSALQMTTNMTATSLTSGGNSCLDEQIERLKRCEYLREGEVKALCLRAREILVDESNVQRVDAPVTVRTLYYCAHTNFLMITMVVTSRDEKASDAAGFVGSGVLNDTGTQP